MRKGSERIGDLIGPLLKKLGLERRVREARIVNDWERIVGRKIADHSKPVGIRGRTLLVNVDSSVWLSELSSFFKKSILERVNEELDEKRFKDIRFRIGDV